MPKSPNFCAATGPPKERVWENLGARQGCRSDQFRSLLLPMAARKAPRAGKRRDYVIRIDQHGFFRWRNDPKKFTCDGPDVSPKLSWNDPPAKTESFALIMDDPDAPAGTWVHWVLYDVPADARGLPERVPKQEQLASGARQGRNDFGKIGYGGPCPPPGKPHRYFFKLYALDTKLNLKPGVTKSDLERTMKSHILTQAELIGRYGR